MTACGDPEHADWPAAELAGRLPADYLFQNAAVEGRACACGNSQIVDIFSRYPIDNLYARVDDEGIKSRETGNGETEMTTKATTDLGRREAEARRIARAEMFPIIYADDDWTFFTLGDGQVVKYDWDEKPHTIHTHFEWVLGRFEGFVS